MRFPLLFSIFLFFGLRELNTGDLGTGIGKKICAPVCVYRNCSIALLFLKRWKV